MSESASDSPPVLDSSGRDSRFATAVNRHGYAFQNAVIYRIETLHRSGATDWQFEAAEFPVAVRSQETRIDALFWVHNTPYWMLAECKRANPAYGDWLFLKSKYIRDKHREMFIAEMSTLSGIPQEFKSTGVELSTAQSGDYVHMALAAKSESKGDPVGGSHDAIEAAASQVCRGMNGMVELLKNCPQLLGTGKRYLLPVIFTTAKLFVSQADLSETDLSTGLLEPAKLKPQEKPFVYYQYHLSPGIKHGTRLSQIYDRPAAMLVPEFVRTIAVVTAGGIEEFLKNFSPRHRDGPCTDAL